jgi:hypothetical protein
MPPVPTRQSTDFKLMKHTTNYTTRILALASLLLLPSTAHCFYNPSTGRWISRDPINERAFVGALRDRTSRVTSISWHETLQVHFTLNQPINRFDFLGLSCSNPCEWATSHGSGEVGITVCCGGKKYPCLIFSGGGVGTSNPKARSIIDACIMVHEQVHVDDPNYLCPKCRNRPSLGEWAAPDPATHIAGEHAAYQAGIDCLKSNKSQCGGDSACEAAIDAEIAAQQRKLELDY